MYRIYSWGNRCEALALTALTCMTLVSCYGADGILASQDAPQVREDVPKGSIEESSKSRMTSERAQPYFRLTEPQKASLIEDLKKIQLGDSRQQVEELLGRPWSDHLVRTKEKNKPIGFFVTYYVVKWSKESVNEKMDQFVLFRFDNGEKLQKIISHVPGVTNRP